MLVVTERFRFDPKLEPLRGTAIRVRSELVAHVRSIRSAQADMLAGVEKGVANDRVHQPAAYIRETDPCRAVGLRRGEPNGGWAGQDVGAIGVVIIAVIHIRRLRDGLPV